MKLITIFYFRFFGGHFEKGSIEGHVGSFMSHVCMTLSAGWIHRAPFPCWCR